MSETYMSMEEEDADYTPSGSQPSVGVSSHASPTPTIAAIEPSQQQQATGNEVIDVDKEPTAKAKQGRREMASRFDMWVHFEQINDSANVVQHGKCKYYMRVIKAESKQYGTLSLRKHFNACKH
jgi:hypothetical protein